MLSKLRIVSALPVLFIALFAGCGGGGGGGSSNPPTTNGRATRFVGQLSSPASTEVGSSAGVGDVIVCVAQTTFCTPVAPDGSFVLDANVGGDIVLVFTGVDFRARLALADVPPGATVRIDDIRCSIATGVCTADDVIVETPLNSPPICDDAVARPALVWPPNHRLVPIAVDGVFDPDGDRIDIDVGDIFQDEAVDEGGSGNTAPDATLDPAQIRAERSGQGNGRVYQLVFVASDGRGGTCSGVVEVCVPHDRGGQSACVDDGGQFDSTAR